MVEENVSSGENTDVKAEEVNNQQVAGENTKESTQDNSVKKKPEKLVPQSEVNKLVYAKKMEAREAYERGQQEGLAQANKDKDLTATTSGQDPDKIVISRGDLRQLVAEESVLQSQDARTKQMIDQFAVKVGQGEQKHSDFEPVVRELGITNLPLQTIETLNNLDNTADVLYELGKNPSKYANVLTLSAVSPALALKELNKLSSSIKQNEDALAQSAKTKVNEPLDQVRPSNAGTDSGELKTVNDFQKEDWLRG